MIAFFGGEILGRTTEVYVGIPIIWACCVGLLALRLNRKDPAPTEKPEPLLRLDTLGTKAPDSDKLIIFGPIVLILVLTLLSSQAGGLSSSKPGDIAMFLLLGVFIILILRRTFLAFLSSKTEFFVSGRAVFPGKNALLSWRMSGRRGVDEIDITAVSEEVTREVEGDRRVMHAKIISTTPVTHIYSAGEMKKGSCSFSLPARAQPSSYSDGKQVLWSIQATALYHSGQKIVQKFLLTAS